MFYKLPGNNFFQQNSYVFVRKKYLYIILVYNYVFKISLVALGKNGSWILYEVVDKILLVIDIR